MSYLVWLVPIALGMGVVGLMAFMWSMRSGQYDDPDGAAERVLLADAADAPLHEAGPSGGEMGKTPRATGTREGPALVQRTDHKERTMTETADRPFDWVAALALVSGVAVIIPPLIALAATLLAVAAALL